MQTRNQFGFSKPDEVFNFATKGAGKIIILKTKGAGKIIILKT